MTNGSPKAVKDCVNLLIKKWKYKIRKRERERGREREIRGSIENKLEGRGREKGSGFYCTSTLVSGFVVFSLSVINWRRSK